jgi:hypothetical protein
VLERVAKKIQDAAGSPLIVAGSRRREQVDSLIVEGVEECYAGPGGARAAALFDHAAFVLWRRGDEAAARACLAAARAFETLPPARNPVARALIDVPLASFFERLEQQEREDAAGSLIVRPGTR